MNNKEKYRQLCQQRTDIPIFMQDWWLQSVCGNDWDAFLIIEGDEIVAGLPYYKVKKYGFYLIVPPSFTPVNGLYVKSGLNTEAYNQIMEELATKVNNSGVAFFACHLSPNITSWLGFYWQGFSSSLRYTYKVDISNIDIALESIKKRRRQYINVAQKNITISDESCDLKSLYSIFENVFKKQNEKVPVEMPIFSAVITESQKQGQGKVFVAKDKQDNITAFLFVVWDNATCYNLISARVTENKDSHSESLLIVEAMRYANALGLKDYDMEGSMIKGVERYYRSFGAKQTPYIVIEKYYSPMYKFLRTLKHR